MQWYFINKGRTKIFLLSLFENHERLGARVQTRQDEYHRRVEQLELKQVQPGLKHFNKDYTNTHFHGATSQDSSHPAHNNLWTFARGKLVIGGICILKGAGVNSDNEGGEHGLWWSVWRWNL